MLFYFPIKSKIITSNKLVMGFLSVPNLNLIALQLDKEGIKGREDGERGRGGAIILSISVKEG